MSDWSRSRIEELLASWWPGEWGANPEYARSTAVVYRSTELDDDGHVHRSSVQRHIPEAKLASKKLSPGDILLEASGGTPGRPVGRVGLYSPEHPEAAICSNFLRTLRPKPGVCSPYLRWVLMDLHRRPQIWRFQQQTTGMINLHVKDYLRHEVDVAPPAEQQQIAKILSTVDEAIEQTEALIAKTQQIKTGLMHDLFTRGVTTDGQLRPPRQEAPQLYKQSPLGWIPKEWDPGELMRWLVGPPKNGYSPREVDEWTGRVMLGLGCLTQDGFLPQQLKNAPANDVRVANAELADGDVLMSRANTRELVGLAGMFRDVGHPCSYPDLIMRLKPVVGLEARFLELSLRSPFVRRQIQAHAVGTSSSMVKISGATVSRLEVAVPSEGEQHKIIQLEESIRRQIEVDRAVLNKLLALKAGLMQDLLTGRVTVAVATKPEAREASTNV